MNFKTYLIISFFVSICLFSLTLFSQKTGFINTELIRDRYPDAKLAEQRCQSVIDEWRRELKSMEDKEEAIQFDIRKNRLIWSDAEKSKKDKELNDIREARVQYAKDKFMPGGESDQMIKTVMSTVEEKILAAVQEVATKEKIDWVWDQATQPLAFVNYKYDLTLKVLKVLGVDVSADEREQQQKVAADPRNEPDKRREASTQQRRRSRSESPQDRSLEATPLNQQNPNMNNPNQRRFEEELKR